MSWMNILKQNIVFCSTKWCLTDYWDANLANKIYTFMNGDKLFHKTTSQWYPIILQDGLKVFDPGKDDKGKHPEAAYTQKDTIFEGYNGPTFAVITNKTPWIRQTGGATHYVFNESISPNELFAPEFNAWDKEIVGNGKNAEGMFTLYNYSSGIIDFPELQKFLELVEKEGQSDVSLWLRDFIPQLVKVEPNQSYAQPEEDDGGKLQGLLGLLDRND